MVRRLTQAGKTIHSVHDAEGNRLAQYDWDAATSTATLLREYIWHDGVPVAVVENDIVYFIRTDHIGRPVFATDDTGTKVWEANYLPFGGVQASTGSNSELRFPGQWFQSESGLHQNWMREYDPTLGRYIQADPLGLVDGASVYEYAIQNLGRYTDPTGEFAVGMPSIDFGLGDIVGDGCSPGVGSRAGADDENLHRAGVRDQLSRLNQRMGNLLQNKILEAAVVGLVVLVTIVGVVPAQPFRPKSKMVICPELLRMLTD